MELDFMLDSVNVALRKAVFGAWGISKRVRLFVFVFWVAS